MSTLRLHVKTLVRSMITRARGQEVYEHLESYLHSNSVIEIDLSGEDPLGMSFLDEVIRHLSEAGHLSRIIFLVEKTEVLHKLARIADIRRVDIHYLDMNTLEKKRVEPLPADTTDVITHAIKPTHGAEAITRPLASCPSRK